MTDQQRSDAPQCPLERDEGHVAHRCPYCSIQKQCDEIAQIERDEGDACQMVLLSRDEALILLSAWPSERVAQPHAGAFVWIKTASAALRAVQKAHPIDDKLHAQIEELLMGVPCPQEDLGFDSPADRAARCDFARQLERELAEAKAARDSALNAQDALRATLAQRPAVAASSVDEDRIDAFIAEWWSDDKEQFEIALRNLLSAPPSPQAPSKDAERLDWLDQSGHWVEPHEGDAVKSWHEPRKQAHFYVEGRYTKADGETAREAIDAALALSHVAAQPQDDLPMGDPHPCDMTEDERERFFAKSSIAPTDSQWRFMLSALVDQCERGNLVDDHGHEFKMNRALIEAREFLSMAQPSAIEPPRVNASAYTDRIGELEETLHELVMLKGMHDEIERLKPKQLSEPRNYRAEELEEDYKNRKPKAWERARSMLE